MVKKNNNMTNIEIFTEALHSIPDFRKRQGRRYNLYNLLIIIVLSMASGSDDFESMALFCVKKSKFLQEQKLEAVRLIYVRHKTIFFQSIFY